MRRLHKDQVFDLEKLAKQFPIVRENIDDRKCILVPGGIGDIYWVMIKMEDFIRKNNISDPPLVCIIGNNESWMTSNNRSVSFIKRIPFVDIAEDPLFIPAIDKETNKNLSIFYYKLSVEKNKCIYYDFMGHHALMCFNSIVNTGGWLEDDELECNWDFPLIASREQESFKDKCIKKYGKYIVFFFSMVGDFLSINLKQFSLDDLSKSINKIIEDTGLTPVFIGAWWDFIWPVYNHHNYLQDLISSIPNAINLCGRTNLDQAFGVMDGAELIVGYHCGLTNMGLVFGKKTVLLWGKGRFPENTPLAIAPPKTRNTTYIPLLTEDLSVGHFVDVMKNLIQEK